MSSDLQPCHDLQSLVAPPGRNVSSCVAAVCHTMMKSSYAAPRCTSWRSASRTRTQSCLPPWIRVHPHFPSPASSGARYRLWPSAPRTSCQTSRAPFWMIGKMGARQILRKHSGPRTKRQGDMRRGSLNKNLIHLIAAGGCWLWPDQS